MGGWNLVQLVFWVFFRSSLHEFLCFMGCTSLHTAQTRGWSLGQLGFMKLFLVSSQDTLRDFIFRSFRSHETQTQWVGELMRNVTPKSIEENRKIKTRMTFFFVTMI